MLIDSGAPTSVSYASNTLPIPHDKDDIAACTAMAGEMLGLKMIYGCRAVAHAFRVSKSHDRCVKNTVNTPLIVAERNSVLREST
ncbi:MAG: hypothetical protein IPJ66_14990 [Bacteroidetes bacterium]|nr:hypothetical protein [Bacteroidota bacterium]